MVSSQSANRRAATPPARASTLRRSLRPRNPHLNYKIEKPPKLKNGRTPKFSAKGLLRHRIVNGNSEYLVEWNGRHPRTHRAWSPTWEPHTNVNAALLRTWASHNTPEGRPDNEGGSDDPNHIAIPETDAESGSSNDGIVDDSDAESEDPSLSDHDYNHLGAPDTPNDSAVDENDVVVEDGHASFMESLGMLVNIAEAEENNNGDTDESDSDEHSENDVGVDDGHVSDVDSNGLEISESSDESSVDDDGWGFMENLPTPFNVTEANDNDNNRDIDESDSDEHSENDVGVDDGYVSDVDSNESSVDDDDWGFMENLPILFNVTEAEENNNRDINESDSDEQSEDDDNAIANPPRALPMSRGNVCVICLESNLELYNVLDCCRQIVCPADEMEWRARQANNIDNPVLSCPYCRTLVPR